MTDPDKNIFEYYVSDLGTLLRAAAFEAKRLRDSANNELSRTYESGRLMAYNEVISVMQQQAIAFGLTLESVGLRGIDPDNDFV